MIQVDAPSLGMICFFAIEQNEFTKFFEKVKSEMSKFNIEAIDINPNNFMMDGSKILVIDF